MIGRTTKRAHGDRNYYTATVGRITEHSLLAAHVFFNAHDAADAGAAYTRVAANAPKGATIAVWARTPGVPAHVPVIGEGEEGAAS